MHLTCGEQTEGGNFRILIGNGTNWKTIYYNAPTTNIDITIANEMEAWMISGCTEIRIGGNSNGDHQMELLPSNIYLESDKDIPLAISSSADWTAFAGLVDAGITDLNANLTADFEVTDGTMIGDGSSDRNAENPKAYSGTFDGQNHTITFNSEKATAAVTAPFRFVKNATIKNLKTAGSMSSTNNIMGGIVGYAQGAVLIDNCGSSMNLTTDDTANDATIGGILGLQNQAPTTVTISNCLYTGTLTGDHGVSGIAGYMRNGDGATISNVLYAGSYVTSNEAPANMVNIVRGGSTLTNCYYVNKIHNSTDGTKADAADLASGKIAYILQGEQATQYWGQSYLNTSRTEIVPKLTSLEADKVVKLSMTNGSADEYANKNGAMPSPVDKGALSFNNGSGGDPYTSFSADGSMSRCFNKYTLSVTAAGATTLVLPVDVTTLPDGVKAYTLTFEGGVVKASEVTSITANKPVLINAAQGNYVFISENNAQIVYDTENAQVDGVLNGIYTNSFSYVPADSYVLQNGAEGLGFYKVDDANTIKITSFRAYLTAPTSARSLNIVYGETTGISTTKTESTKNNEIYNLNGQRVSKAQKGLYIVNGKKAVRK